MAGCFNNGLEYMEIWRDCNFNFLRKVKINFGVRKFNRCKEWKTPTKAQSRLLRRLDNYLL